MFTTVLKHEARSMGPQLLVYLGIVAVLMASGLLVAATGVEPVASFGTMVAAAGGLFLHLAVPVTLLERYYKSLYGREGYLTMALPVKASTLYWAKITWAYVVWLAAALIACGSWIAIALIRGGFDAFAQALSTTPALAIGFFAVLLVVSLALYVVQFAWIVTLGMEERFRALGLAGPVVVWLGSYLALQVVSVVAILLIPFGVSPDLGRIVLTPPVIEIGTATGHDLSFIPLGFIPVVLAAGAVFVLWTLRSLRDHTSLR